MSHFPFRVLSAIALLALLASCSKEAPPPELTAFQEVEAKALKGDKDAQYEIARMYWDGPGKKWYLKGEYNRLDNPQNWINHNYAQQEGPGNSSPSLAAAMDSVASGSGVPSSQDIRTLQPTASDSLTWARVLRGTWTSSSGKKYNLYNGDFWRSDYLNQRLECVVDDTVQPITPVYQRRGTWYQTNKWPEPRQKRQTTFAT